MTNSIIINDVTTNIQLRNALLGDSSCLISVFEIMENWKALKSLVPSTLADLLYLSTFRAQQELETLTEMVRPFYEAAYEAASNAHSWGDQAPRWTEEMLNTWQDLQMSAEYLEIRIEEESWETECQEDQGLGYWELTYGHLQS